MVVGNIVGRKISAFGSDDNEVVLVLRTGEAVPVPHVHPSRSSPTPSLTRLYGCVWLYITGERHQNPNSSGNISFQGPRCGKNCLAFPVSRRRPRRPRLRPSPNRIFRSSYRRFSVNDTLDAIRLDIGDCKRYRFASDADNDLRRPAMSRRSWSSSAKNRNDDLGGHPVRRTTRSSS